MADKRWRDEDFLTIERLRGEGLEWDVIGPRLGVTGNAARKNYARWLKRTGQDHFHEQAGAGFRPAAERIVQAAQERGDTIPPLRPQIQPMPTIPSQPLENAPQLPPAFPREYVPLQIDDVGSWLILSDIHLPYHETRAIEAAIAMGQRRNVVGVLLNGDILDSHELSRFDKDPTAPRYKAERDAALLFFAYLRYKFPKARIIFKEGNHSERLYSYLMQRAPALFGFEEIALPNILKLDNFGIEYIGDKRVIRLGKLNIIHGHEFKPNVQAPVNPARGLFLRAKAQAMCGHHHQTSEHHEPTITGKPIGCWSTGCLCQLNPSYCPLNKWNHGAAVVDLHSGGTFSVYNFRIADGTVI